MKSLEFEKVSVADARKALEGPPKTEDKDNAAPAVRRPGDVNPVLLDATIEWMAGLPYAVRPTELARRFPRIANSIAELWRRVSRCEEYLDSMVVDQRGDRKGFPPAVAMEITALRAYYAELHPRAKSTTWDPEHSR
jgi:hypothetical protein